MTEFTQQSPLRDLIEIPERVEAADFVIKLDEGVARHTQTVKDYVVTDAIAEAIGEGLDLVAASLARQSSRGAFLDGSFGSGKSHYMAVLHLLLTGSLEARQIPGLAPTIAARQDLLGHKLLALDYNLLGATSFEDAIFKGYLKTVAEKHPDAPAPILHASDALLVDARNMRAHMGDDAFFAGLGSGDSAWGALASAWDAASFDAASTQRPGSPDRDRLVGDLIESYFSGYARAGQWLPMEDGLQALSAHAKSLGYQGLVFMIDEIVLWLGQHLTNEDWVRTETEKVVQLAENAAANLPIPITSFLARQRDLRDFLGTHASGAERAAHAQVFEYWEERFSKIKLQAADLPKIVKQRLLQPKNPAAAATLQSALTEVKRDYAAWGYLLSDDAHSDEKAFGDVYPFSPALVDTMVALSSLMQRERTALKLMAELLRDGRNTLRVSDVIPVGDLYAPVVLGGSQPLTDEMKQHFQISSDFYLKKMRPYLLRKHSLTEATTEALDRNHAFVTEDRLAKTVLIAALAPEAKSLSNLTAAKLAALNYGTIDAFIPGQEASQALTLVREWASEFGEVSVGDGADPIITATLSGVDYDSILQRVVTEDNPQARRELVRKMIAHELNLSSESLVGRRLSHVWRGQKRNVVVKFGNVRDTSDVLDSDLVHSDADWHVIIDFPYDSGDRRPSDDLARLRQVKDDDRRANTIAWVPNFLSDPRQTDLGKLVQLEFLLKGNHFDENAIHLPVADRGPARQNLEAQRRTLREVIAGAIRQAYHVNTPEEVNVSHELGGSEIFQVLLPGVTIAPPPTGTLLEGIHHALDTAWAAEFPDHPDLGADEVTVRRLTEAVDLVTATVEAGGRRQGLTLAEQRVAREVVSKLKLGTVNENVLVVDRANFGWSSEFARWEGELGESITIDRLREKMHKWGMTRHMEDAVLITWALLGNYDLGSTGTLTIGGLGSGAVPRLADIPSEEDWSLAGSRAGTIFGITPEHNRTVRAVSRFADNIRARATTSTFSDLVGQLEAHADVLGLDTAALLGRLATARRLRGLTAALSGNLTDTALIETLASFDLPDELTAFAATHATAQHIVQHLSGLDWDMVTAALSRNDAKFGATVTALQETARVDESIAKLEPQLHQLAADARALLMNASGPETPPAPAPAPQPEPSARPEQSQISLTGHTTHTTVAELDAALAQLGKAIRSETQARDTDRVTITWQVDES
ncbi:hypothetical protein GCM10009860_15300 [Microbacterium mitrae]|uniref:Phage resistance protein n=1 Tax=Microbacterium mitrae TaxID=664640 RepID=A0A5C8HMC9_9MICO|nr:hypothetical protein [Microbacterium mitrae]TXK03392.1 hypothetical protein FVP60_10910 [Microbacterium mitrae]